MGPRSEHKHSMLVISLLADGVSRVGVCVQTTFETIWNLQNSLVGYTKNKLPPILRWIRLWYTRLYTIQRWVRLLRKTFVKMWPFYSRHGQPFRIHSDWFSWYWRRILAKQNILVLMAYKIAQAYQKYIISKMSKINLLQLAGGKSDQQKSPAKQMYFYWYLHAKYTDNFGKLNEVFICFFFLIGLIPKSNILCDKYFL